ncbi:MAG: TIGR02099 family protein, partial [Pseudomonas sp.]|nr:TIGR02099 family protein [Pseudomonas sp.]
STPLRGQLPYRLRVLLADEDSLLRVLSDLRGLHIDLPEPFGKSAEQRRDMAWRMTLSGAERRYWLDMDGLLSLAAAAAPQRLRDGRGEVRLGGAAARLPVQPGWSLRGALQQLDLQEWQRWHQQHQAQQPTDLRWLSLVDLDIAQIRVGELTIDQAAVQLQPQAEAWRLALRSPLVSGSLLWPAQGEAPLQLQLDYLDLPRGETPVDPSTALPRPDPLAGFDPRRVPAMDMQIDELRLAGVPVGRWRLQTRPQADGVRLQQLDLQMRGLQLTGEATWTGSAEHSQSSYRGRLQGSDLGKVLRAWDYAPSASSESFRVDVDAHWPGSPAWVSLKRVSGDLHARLDKGQFVEADGGSQALRVFGLLNFNSIARRLRLDFSDLLGRGLAYDKVRGQLHARDGVFVTSKPLRLSGPSSNLELNGTLDMANEQIDAKLLVTLPVSNNLPLAAVAVGAPAIGGALFVVDKLLGDRLARFASVQYDVKGPWNEPQISFDKPFEKPR